MLIPDPKNVHLLFYKQLCVCEDTTILLNILRKHSAQVACHCQQILPVDFGNNFIATNVKVPCFTASMVGRMGIAVIPASGTRPANQG